MKKVLFIVSIALWTSISACAQLLGSIDFNPKDLSVTASFDSIVTRAINGSIVIVKQSYQVKNRDNGKTYGQNGRSDFGHNYSIGVKTEAGLVLTDGALKPWLYDEAYKRVEDKYEPIISLTEIREVVTDGQTKFIQNPLHIGKQQPEGMWIANGEKVSPNAMEIEGQDGEKEGYIIWFISKKKLDDAPNSAIDVKVVNRRIEVKGEDIEVDAPSGKKMILGGVYVCPAFLGGGHVAYKLVGCMVNFEGRWMLRTPFIGMTIEKTQEDLSDEDTEQPVEVELTPIDGDKKSKGGKRNK